MLQQREVGRLVDEQCKASGKLKAAPDLSLAIFLAGSDELDGDLISGRRDGHKVPRRSSGWFGLIV